MIPKKAKVCKVTSVMVAAVFFVSFIVAGFYYAGLKRILISRISEKASALIGQPVAIGDISFSMLSGITLEDLQLHNPEGFARGQLLRIKRLSIRPDYRDLSKGRLHFAGVIVDGPELFLMKDNQGRLNISDGLMRFLSKKGDLEYRLDEFSVRSGRADFNKDLRLTGERIDLTFKNISSLPGTKTDMEGSVLWAGENKVTLHGWIHLKDEARGFSISAEAADVGLTPFKEALTGYPIDTSRTRIDMRISAEGDTLKGVRIISSAKVMSPGYAFYKRPRLDISMDADIFYDIPARLALLNAFSLKAGDASTLALKGRIEGLQGNLSYDLQMKNVRLDLSSFSVAKGVEIGGLLTSDAISIKGRLNNTWPEVAGTLRLRNAFFKSDAHEIKGVNTEIVFSSGRDIVSRTEGSGVMMKAAGHRLTGSSAFRFSLRTTFRRNQLEFSANAAASPVGVETGDNLSLEARKCGATLEGVVKGRAFSGDGAISAEGIQLAGYTLESLKAGFGLEYKNNAVTFKHPEIASERFSLSADAVEIKMNDPHSGFSIAGRGLNGAYPERQALIRGSDFSGAMNAGAGGFTGDFKVNVAEADLQGTRAGNITGTGWFDGQVFSVEVLRADVGGGMISLHARGTVPAGPFPLEATASARNVSLDSLSAVLGKGLGPGYKASGYIGDFSFNGRIDSAESAHGKMSVDLMKLSLLNSKTGRNVLKDALLHSVAKFGGRECTFQGSMGAGTVAAKFSGTAKDYMGVQRTAGIEVRLEDTLLTELRNSFWDVFPDSLLYAGMEGSISSDIRADYDDKKFVLTGNLKLKDIVITGENGEYSAGPVKGVIPLSYGMSEGKGKTVDIPFFEKGEFEDARRYYSGNFQGDGYNRITIGSLQYGFRLMDDISIWLRLEPGILNVGRFSANIFGGTLKGSAAADISNGFQYRAGMVLEGLSLTRLCDDIPPIKGYISGKVDGMGIFKGSGFALPQIIGKADFWAYRTKDEKTRISREFLQKIGGPSVRAYLGDRSFNKGVLSLYIQNGFLIFRELEIANRNLFGIQDLSVKVAPLNNRIAIDHLMWTIVEAANRAKEK